MAAVARPGHFNDPEYALLTNPDAVVSMSIVCMQYAADRQRGADSHRAVHTDEPMEHSWCAET